MFRKPDRKETRYFVIVVLLFALGTGYAIYHDLSLKALFLHGLLQQHGVSGEAAR